MGRIIDPYRFASSGCAADTVTIFDSGTGFDSDGQGYPSVNNSWYSDSCTHMIILASEINALCTSAKSITGLDFELASSSGLTTSPDHASVSTEVYVAHTALTSMPTTGVLTNLSGALSGNYTDRSLKFTDTFNSGLNLGWQTMNFSSDFTYDGTSNILLSFYRSTSSYQSGRRTTYVFGTQTSGGSNLVRSATYGDDSVGNPANNNYTCDTATNGRNINIKINYE